MNINVLAPVNSLGYGVAGLNFLVNMHDQGHQVSYFPIGNLSPDDVPPKHHEMIKEMVANATMFDTTAPCLRIWHQHDMAQMVGNDVHFGMPIFELDTFTDIEKHQLSTLDTIIVNSKWARGVIKDQVSNEPSVEVVPLGVDRSIFKPPQLNSPSKNTIFLNVGKWEIRKGHDILLTAFEKAFKPDDDVELWMCCGNPFYSPEENKEWEDYYLKSKLGDKVRIIPRQESQEGLAHIMNSADCGVFPSRGEGWNLELLEMMSCGKQVIATNYSAHTEFCNEDNTLLVGDCQEDKLLDPFDVEPAYDGKWFKGQGNWALISNRHIEILSFCMQIIHKDKQEGTDMINYAGIETAKEYSWENSTKKLMEVLG